MMFYLIEKIIVLRYKEKGEEYKSRLSSVEAMILNKKLPKSLKILNSDNK